MPQLWESDGVACDPTLIYSIDEIAHTHPSPQAYRLINVKDRDPRDVTCRDGVLHAVANGDEMVSLDVGLSFLLCLVIALRVRLVTPLVNPHQGRLKELGVQPFREGLKR
eukprot:CAMPEP_0181233836 /NCGR_PEP_ID=MMETSP1096-20121128/36586_1 /TAXON_ID=156174 ORGANISM="Chrysochromulina ericina, Strain CCMP281" /NCGR_SAMPLE_ID=MMETSP1096 /ASSEMBLY_ACC=CAM_ASM_000453 /LENGTH=109 /DNA_ID=CAMNT_0023328439 /DNA_START=452 /DNA_END=778 /DNA_ORIENTATION=-